MAKASQAVTAVNVVKTAPVPRADLREKAIERLLARKIEPSPQALLEDSADPKAPLHEFFYKTPPDTWADFGRYTAARRIIQLAKVEFVRNGKSFDVRMIENVKIGAIERWGTVEQIIKSPDLRDAYLKQVEETLQQAATKLSRARELLNEQE